MRGRKTNGKLAEVCRENTKVNDCMAGKNMVSKQEEGGKISMSSYTVEKEYILYTSPYRRLYII